MFELRDEVCNAVIRDLGDDEFSVRVKIGEDDLMTSGFYYPNKNRLEAFEPYGKQAIAKKFL